jgi:hypothetical protein
MSEIHLNTLFFAVKSQSEASATCETFGIGIGFRLLNSPCSGLYPSSIKKCSPTQDLAILNLEVQRLQKVIESTNQSLCEANFKTMCSRVTSKLSEFRPLILVGSHSPNATRIKAHGVYVVEEVLASCCDPLSECADDEGCSSYTPYNVQECCSNCESTYEKCYDHMNQDSGDSLFITCFAVHVTTSAVCALYIYGFGVMSDTCLQKST